MSDAGASHHPDLEALLRRALAPIEPPADLTDRLEARLQSITELAADELETFVVHPAELGKAAFAHVVRPRDLHVFFRGRTRPAEWRGEERRAAAR